MDKGVIYMPPDNCSWGKLPASYWFQTITPKIIASWQYPPENFPWGKLPFGWFVACIIAPRKTTPPPRIIVPRINYTRYVFVPRISNRSSFFLDFDFCIKKWNCLKKKNNKSRTNLVWNNETELYLLSQQIGTNKVDHRKVHKILFKKKQIVSLSNFSMLVIFSMKFYTAICSINIKHFVL